MPRRSQQLAVNTRAFKLILKEMQKGEIVMKEGRWQPPITQFINDNHDTLGVFSTSQVRGALNKAKEQIVVVPPRKKEDAGLGDADQGNADNDPDEDNASIDLSDIEDGATVEVDGKGWGRKERMPQASSEVRVVGEEIALANPKRSPAGDDSISYCMQGISLTDLALHEVSQMVIDEGYAVWNYRNTVWKCGALHNHQTTVLWLPSALILEKVDFYISEGGTTCFGLYDEVSELSNLLKT